MSQKICYLMLLTEKRDYTEGSILKAILAITIPIVLANILQTVYQLTDTFWVGRLGAEAIASVSISFPILFFITSLGSGLAIAGSILVAQYYGKKDHLRLNHVAAQTILFCLAVSIVLSVIGYLCSPLLIKLLQVDPNVFRDATAYLQISFMGIIFVYTYFIFQSLMRGIGEVKIPLYLIMGTVTLNFFLDPVMIFGWKIFPALGVKGAAIATILSQALAAIIGMIILIRGKSGIKFGQQHFHPNFPLMKKIFYLGVPASLEQSIRSVGMYLMTVLVAGFGTITLAAYGLGTRIFSFVIIPAIGLSIANSTLVGQNMGAGKIERAEKISKISMIVGFIVLSVVGILMFIFAQPLAKIFIPNDPMVINSSVEFIRILCLTFGLVGIQMVLIGTFRGAGSTFTAMMLSLAGIVSMFVIALFLSRYTSLEEKGIWWSYLWSNLFGTIITLIWYYRGKWKDKKITEEIKLEETVSGEILAEEGIR